jgi:hypothetical protein
MKREHVWGASADATKDANCSVCVLRDRCKDPKKHKKYCCTLFQSNVVGKEDEASRDFATYLRELARSENVLVDSYGIDDRDAKEAPNFYRWCTNDKWLKSKPFPWQLQVGMKVYGDCCPWCSDKSWYKNIPFDCDPEEIPERIQLRRFGRCPKCDRTIVDGINAKKEHDVSTFIGIVGQRSGKCLVAGTLIPTTKGVKPIESILVDDEIVVRGQAHRVDEVFVTKGKKVATITTSYGYQLTGTRDHLLQTTEGWQPLSRAQCVMISAEKSEGVDVESIKNEVVEESFSGTSLIITLKHQLAAEKAQQKLLSFQIFCKRLKHQLVIDQPYAFQYVEQIGLRKAHLSEHFRISHRIGETQVHKAACQAITALMREQGFDKMEAHPGILHEVQAFFSYAIAGRMKRADIVRGLESIRKLPAKDVFLRHLLYTLCEGVASGTIMFDNVVSFHKSGKADVFDISVPTARKFVANGIEVHNSTGIGYLDSYLIHRLLKLKNPSAFYGLKAGTVLEMSFVGINFTNARKYMWEPMMMLIDDSPWFSTYHEILEDHARKAGIEELYRLKDTFIFYRSAAIRAQPQSPSTRALRGSTRISFTVDELGRFSENKELVNISGDEIWVALNNSLSTVGPLAFKMREEGVVWIPPTLAAGISSPREVGDPIMTLHKRHLSDPSAYVMLKPTWEANPNISFKYLESKHDNATLWRDFGCRPPMSEAPFIASSDMLFESVGKKPAAWTQKTRVVRNRAGENTSVAIKLAKTWVDSNVPKILAFDAGATFNAFAGALAHVGENGEFVYDGFFEVAPRPRLPVNYHEVYEQVFKPIIGRYGVVAVASDRWQNVKFHSDVQADFPKVKVASCRLDYGDFLEWREALTQHEIIIPRPEIDRNEILDPELDENALNDKPVARFLRETLRVEDVPGKTVDKPSNGNDDIFRAAVVAHTAIRIPEIARQMRQASIIRNSPGAIGAGAFGSMPMRITVPAGIGTMPGLQIPPEPPMIPLTPKVYRDKISVGGRHHVLSVIPSKKTPKRR